MVSRSTVTLLCLVSILPIGLGSLDEERLVHDLFTKQGYNALIRPVRNLTDVIEVTFGLTLFQVILVEERSQIMKINSWMRYTWMDIQMEWDSALYGGIQSVRLPCPSLWKPDIVLLNNADGKYEVSYCSNLIIFNDGTIQWIPPAIYTSTCEIDVEYFPFDQQKCEMKFGSWTFSADQVTIALARDKCDVSNYVISGTWDLMECPAKVNPPTDVTKQPMDITFMFTLRRKTLFYTVNLLTPCVLISFLSVLTFYLPADAQEKVTLCISILLALVVFLLLVSKSLPPTSVTVPLISKYLFFTFMMNIVTVILSVAIININFRSPKTYSMPRWIQVVFLYWLPIMLLMQRPDHKKKFAKWRERRTEEQEVKRMYVNGKGTKDRGRENKDGVNVELLHLAESETDAIAPPPLYATTLNNNEGGGLLNMTPPRRRKGHPLSENAVKAADAIDYITSYLKRQDDCDAVCNDWKYVAAVIDRLLLLIFLAVTISGTISIIVDAPFIFEFVDQEERLKELL